METPVESVTDIEIRERPQELVAEVRKKIDDSVSNISTCIRVGHRPHHGQGHPADHWESVAKKGFQLVYGATMNLFVKPARRLSRYGPEAAN